MKPLHTMPPAYRKRRSQSCSSGDESDEKRMRRHYTATFKSMSRNKWSLTSENSQSIQKNNNTQGVVVVLDCKKLQQDVMLLVYNTDAHSWLTLPLEYRMSDLEDPQKFLTATNLVGFVRNGIIFWKDEQSLISVNMSKTSIDCFPSMGTGRCYTYSKWKYICALNQLFAVNIYNTGEMEGRFERAMVNVMTYSFKDKGWEKIAEHQIQKRIGSNPLVLGTEDSTGFWICIADYFIHPQSLKLEKHDLHVLFIENHTWAFDPLDCSDLTEAYGKSQHFPSLSTDSQGHLCVYIEPVLYTFATETSDWSEVDITEPAAIHSVVLAETKILTGLKKFVFKLDMSEDTCEFTSVDLETGDEAELDVPPINIFRKAPHLSSVIRRQNFRIANVVGDSKLTSYRVSDNVLEKARETTFEQFECEF